MKRKMLGIFGSVCCIAAATFGLTSCGEPNENGSKWGNEYTLSAAYQEAQELGYTGSLEEFIQTVSGKDGKDGSDGKDGVGIADILLDDEGILHIVLSNGTEKILGKLVGEDGKDGEDGADGKDGKNGEDGESGLSAYEIYKKYHPDYQGSEAE